MYKIISKKMLNKYVQQMTVHAPYVAKHCRPGQFIILRVNSEGERIPLTIADFDRGRETVTIIYQVVGYTTQVLSKMEVGQFIEDFVGPLGKPKKMQKVNKVLGIAGGVGAAPLLPQLKSLSETGADIDIILGARNQELLILEQELKALSNKLYIATNDGSKGTKGFVTQILTKLLKDQIEYDEIIAIGPLPMMKAVVEITRQHNIPTSVSLNPLMIDGTGMCGGCRVTIGGETKFACVDGPDFNGFLVDFDECISRNKFYHEEEHICRLSLRGKGDHE